MKSVSKIYFLTYQHTEGLCGQCLKQVIVKKQKLRLWPNLLLAFLTLGIWSIFWYKNAKRLDRQWRCSQCGCEVYRLIEFKF